MQKILAGFLSVFVFAVPVYAWAAIGIPCDGPNCTFDDVIKLANNIIKFLMYDVAVPLAALGFMFMGARMVLFPDKESEKTKAKEGAMDIIKGFAIMLGAYVLIKTVLFMFLTSDQTTFLGFMFQ